MSRARTRGTPGLDVAIVGAGVAGLAAARELARVGLRVRVLEARRRVGGRVLTRHVRGIPLPIELGAEFIHGEAPETARLLAESGGVSYAVGGDHRVAHRGTLRRADFWGRINDVLERVDDSRPDESFADFLARRPGGPRRARDRAAAREFVQGFHAADVGEIGVHALAPGDHESPGDAAAQSSRIVGGQGTIVGTLARGLGDRIALGAVVRSIAWRRGEVELEVAAPGVRRPVRARAAIVTLPVGVLEATVGERGAVTLAPEPPRLRDALERVAMGSAVRVVVWFREFPWRPLAGRRGIPPLDGLGYLHTRGTPFNVWWTARPMQAPLAVGWCGGPPSRAFAGRPAAEVARAALDSLAGALGVPPRHVRSRALGSWTHDWSADPFSRGAYSYPRVGGAEAWKAFARPIQGTLFFAGEHSDEGSGTVEGAIASGRRAARQLARAIGRRG